MIGKWVAACLCVLGLWAGQAGAQALRFDLMGPQGQVTEKSYPGKYLLLAIGYTSCPDICPTTLYEYGLTMKALKNPEALQPIFVTIDPVNDDIDRLNAYTQYFDARIVGLSGEMKNIQHLADQLGATFGYRMDGKRVDVPQKGMIYNVYHSALIYLIGPDRQLLDVYDYQIGAQGLTAALDKVLGEGQGHQRAPAPQPEKQAAPPPSNAPRTAGTPPPPAAACPLPAGFEPRETGLALQDILPPQAPALRRKVVLLNVWALWCAPCRTELPLLDKLAARQDALAVQTLNLNDKEADIAALFSKMGLQHLPRTRTQDSGLLKRLGAAGLPLTALFVDGRQVAAKSGVIDRTDDFVRYARCVRGPGA